MCFAFEALHQSKHQPTIRELPCPKSVTYLYLVRNGFSQRQLAKTHMHTEIEKVFRMLVTSFHLTHRVCKIANFMFVVRRFHLICHHPLNNDVTNAPTVLRNIHAFHSVHVWKCNNSNEFMQVWVSQCNQLVSDDSRPSQLTGKMNGIDKKQS